MTERTPPPLAVDPETWRAHQLDALLADTRDVAILIVAFPSGGRRAAAGLRIEQLREGPPVQKHRTLVGRIEA